MALFLQLLVASVLVTSAVSDLKCENPRKDTMKFSLRSQRNETGHWVAQINFNHYGNNAMEKSFWDVDVTHSVVSCNGAETVNILATLTAHSQIPGPGYELYPGKGYYKFHAKGLIWDEALHTCTQEGAHLAIINSLEESKLLKDMYAKFPKMEGATEDGKFAFLGFNDLKVEGKFETIFGELLNNTGYSTFMPGQPNNTPFGTDMDQDCGGMNREGLLNDLPCHGRYPFICELELPH